MIRKRQVSLFEMLMGLSRAVDLISNEVVNHQIKVGYIALCLGAEMGLPPEQQDALFMAGALHDVGALSLQERLDLLEFETQDQLHGERGYRLLRRFPPLARAAEFIRYHHAHWRTARKREDIPLGSLILHLADRVAVVIDDHEHILQQVPRIKARVLPQSGEMFMPDVVDAFQRLAARQHFWLYTVSDSLYWSLGKRLGPLTVELDMEGLLGISRLFSRIIDFRSRFTATHSQGVAASAEALAALMGFSARECQMIRVAGNLHDLGKLAVPSEILEKPGRLTDEEYSLMKGHSFYTYHILEAIEELEIITLWASFHHERLDGSGYPFQISGDQLPLPARIVAVADVFTAITEDRPYRAGMDPEAALGLLRKMAEEGALDRGVVGVLADNFSEVNSVRHRAQEDAHREYEEFQL